MAFFVFLEVFMKRKLKDIIIGPPLENTALEGEKFKVVWGLPIYASDTISSVAYAGEEILLVLLPVMAMAATGMLVKVMCAIIALLAILVICYRQTIDAYPQGGGAYIVGVDNLGTIPGLVAASSLSVGYILTVAVSSCSGAAAVVSAFPALAPYKALLAFFIVCILTWGNLRGMRESSVMFGLPTYFFIISIIVLIITGFVRVILGYEPPEANYTAEAVGDITIFLVLRAFASGCTALTGVEAVSNGVPSFREPSAKNAKLVLTLMACIVGFTFISVAALTDIYHVFPTDEITAVAALASAVFGQGSLMFYVFQIATVIILSLAANTAFAGMPLLLAMVAKDGYMPRQFAQRGARLNFSNGVLMIFFLASALIFLFNADTHALLPLYATGVFVSFTISQAGMLVHWYRKRGEGWKKKAAVNAAGTLICALVCVVIAVTRFLEGAWVVVVLIPLLVIMKLKIKKHYDSVAQQLRITGNPAELLHKGSGAAGNARVLMPVQSLNKSFIKALNYAVDTGAKEIEFYFVSDGSGKETQLEKELSELKIPNSYFNYDVTLLRNTNDILLKHVDELTSELGKGEMLTVVMPQFVCKEKWASILHNQTSIQLKLALSERKNVTVVSVPYIA